MRSRRSSALSDTSPDATEVLLEVFRKAAPWRKLEVVSDLKRTLRELVLSELGAHYPGKAAKGGSRMSYLLRKIGSSFGETTTSFFESPTVVGWARQPARPPARRFGGWG